MASLLVLSFAGISFGQEFFVKDGVKTIEGPRYVPMEIIVKFKPGVSSGVVREINQKHGTSVIKTSRFAGFKRLRIPRGRTVEQMVAIYKKNSNVEYAEANFIAHAFWIPNDEFYSYQWHLDNADYGGIGMEEAWDLSTGAGVTVAVIDTGVAYEDYVDAVSLGKSGKFSYITYEQAPDLVNTDFVVVPGSDLVNDDDHPNDDEGHGTHVAGTIAQTTNNGIGVAGVAFDCSIMPVKVLDSAGSGTYADIADGIYFAADNGAQVINMSLGGPVPSITLENALAHAYNAGVTIVCASGNDGSADTVSYPAAYDAYCIAVGATRYDEEVSYYSNGGPSLDLTAPGGDIYEDQNGDGYGDGVLQQTHDGSDYTNFGYYFYQGTSMASPHVAGVGISGIDMSTSVIKLNGWYTYATATVTIVDADGSPVQGATVSGAWSGITSDADSGVTDSAGEVTLESDPVKNAVGTFTFTVANVSLTDWEYDSTANDETSDSITVP